MGSPIHADARTPLYLQKKFQQSRQQQGSNIFLILGKRCPRKKIRMKTAGLLLFCGSFNIIVEFHRTFAPPPIPPPPHLRRLRHSHDMDGSRIGVKSTLAPFQHIQFWTLHHSLLLIRQEKSVSPSPPVPPLIATNPNNSSHTSLIFHTSMSFFDTRF